MIYLLNEEKGLTEVCFHERLKTTKLNIKLVRETILNTKLMICVVCSLSVPWLDYSNTCILVGCSTHVFHKRVACCLCSFACVFSLIFVKLYSYLI